MHVDWSLPRFATLVAVRHHELNLPTDGEYIDVHIVRLCSALVQLKRQRWRIELLRGEIDESCRALNLDGYALRTLDTQIRSDIDAVHASFDPRPRRRAAH